MGIFSAKKTNEEDLKDEVDAKKEKETVKEKSMKDLYEESEDPKKKKSVKNPIAYKILVKPLVTEKAANLGELNQYAFVVSVNANKIDVAKAIKEVYGVDAQSVNIIKMKGKKVTRGRISGRRKDFKKAIVSLKKGDTISIYEGV